MPVKLRILGADDHVELEQVRQFFRNYAAWLGVDLDYQNFGDEMVGSVIRNAAKDLGRKVVTIPVDAQTDKVKRAMLVSPLCQKGRVRLVGYFGPLERQLTTWSPGSSTSPDRLDAFVWGITHLLLQQPRRGMVV